MIRPEIFTLLTALVCAMAGGWTVWRASDLPRGFRVALTAVTAVAALVATLAASALWLSQAADPWNAARLAPSVALHHGYKLYYPLDTGPVLSTVVGPVAFLAYWPIGFLNGSPSVLILAASALNLIAFGLVMCALLRRAGADAAETFIGALVVLQLALFYPSLRYSVFNVHADAPAILLAATGLFALCRSTGELSWRDAALAALCFTLATWAKQSLALVFVAAILALALREGWRAAVRFIGASAIIGTTISLIFVGWYGLDTLRMNMFSVPAGHPWLRMDFATGEVYRTIEVTGTLGHLKTAVSAMLHLVRQNWPLFALFGVVLGERLLRRGPGERWWPRTPWAVFVLMALVMLPTVAIGRVKLGGEENHESFSQFFLCAALGLWLVDRSADRRLRLARAGAVAAVLLLLNLPFAGRLPHAHQLARDNQNETALRYERAHPDLVFFPWNPLTSLLSTGKLYHFDYGVFDRNLGGATVSAGHIAEAMPSPRPIIASYIAHHDHILRTYFPEYVSLPPDPELPDWKLYGPP